MKRHTRWIAASLAVAMAFAPACAFASEAASEKEEVIYITTDGGGNTTSVNAVNIFGSGDVVDYGDYSDVKLLTSTERITQNGDKITFRTDDKKVYYQGTMEQVETPWDISVRYYLDGKEYEASEIAGKSGKLEIHLSIKENTACKGNFYDRYALQASLTLDSEICENISAPDATIANVGSDKQLTYTVLPGKGLAASIKADVKDFEMESISINGIRLNLNIEIDDAELMKQVRALMDATKKLNDGAAKLDANSNTLKTESGRLDSGISSVHDGVVNLDNGVVALEQGVSSVQGALNSLNEKSDDLTGSSAQIKAALETIQKSLSPVAASAGQLKELTSASGSIKKGISDLYDGAAALHQNLGAAQYKAVMAQKGLDIDALQAGNTQAIKDLSAQISSLRSTLSSITDQKQEAELEAQIAALEKTVKLLSGNNAAIDGTESYLDNLAGGANSLYVNLGTLKAQYERFDAEIAELVKTLDEMPAQLTALSKGIDQLVTNYALLDTGINEYTGGVTQVALGYAKIVDGVSSLTKGSEKLLSGSDALHDGAGKLAGGIAAYCDGVSSLNDGTKELYDETSGMDKKIQEEIEEILGNIGGEETETVSFVSEKNTKVDSVQFVIKTEAIEKAEAPADESKEETTLTFWQKLLSLFGLY